MTADLKRASQLIRGGELVAAGTHDDLMKTSESYRRIFSE